MQLGLGFFAPRANVGGFFRGVEVRVGLGRRIWDWHDEAQQKTAGRKLKLCSEEGARD